MTEKIFSSRDLYEAKMRSSVNSFWTGFTIGIVATLLAGVVIDKSNESDKGGRCNEPRSQEVTLEERNRIVQNLNNARERLDQLDNDSAKTKKHLPEPERLVCIKNQDGQISFYIREDAEPLIEELSLDEE